MAINIELTEEEQSIVDEYIYQVENEILPTCQKHCGNDTGVYTDDNECPKGEGHICQYSNLWNQKEMLKTNKFAAKLYAKRILSAQEEPIDDIVENIE